MSSSASSSSSSGRRGLEDNLYIPPPTAEEEAREAAGEYDSDPEEEPEVQEVRAGQECGMAFERYEDIREGDVIEIFTTEEIERTL